MLQHFLATRKTHWFINYYVENYWRWSHRWVRAVHFFIRQLGLPITLQKLTCEIYIYLIFYFMKSFSRFDWCMRDLVHMVCKSFYFSTLNLIFVCDFWNSSFARNVISYMITCCRVAIRDYMIQTCLCVRTFFPCCHRWFWTWPHCTRLLFSSGGFGIFFSFPLSIN